ncbi:hypothetical protein cyc_05310 [Cyclospora cayetanensis]|uniref:Uncharacterized protein n=1 Tax=Cyclospora cayetanensis TaxID=88456 RepID=A0A1D3CWL2_9EIME|nr:hypothetical protein cyc_05310 [Cyclospora cayetanensis]
MDVLDDSTTIIRMGPQTISDYNVGAKSLYSPTDEAEEFRCRLSELPCLICQESEVQVLEKQRRRDAPAETRNIREAASDNTRTIGVNESLDACLPHSTAIAAVR